MVVVIVAVIVIDVGIVIVIVVTIINYWSSPCPRASRRSASLAFVLSRGWCRKGAPFSPAASLAAC